MGFRPKAWQNTSVGGTRLNAAALIDLERRVTAYADQAADNLDAVVTISAFQAGHGWVDRAEFGDQADDRADKIIGDQSMRFAPDDADPYTTTLTLRSAVDMSTSLIGIWLKLDGGSVDTLKLQVASAGGVAEVLLYDKDTLEPWLKGSVASWEPTWVARSMFTTTSGTIDWTAITAVSFVSAADGAWFLAESLRLGWLGLIPEPPRGCVSIGFDDGWAGVMTYGLPALSLVGLPASAFIIADAIGTANYMTEANLLSLQNDYGWEIGAHAATATNHNAGFDGLSNDVVEGECRGIQSWLADRGLKGWNILSWPLGQTAKEAIARRLFRLALSSRGSAGRRSELFRPFEHDRHHLRYWSVNGLTVTVADIKAAIDQAAADRTWLIICFHNLVSGTPAATTEFRASNFVEIADYLARANVHVRTVGDHARRLGLVSDTGPSQLLPVPVVITGTLTTTTYTLLIARVPAGRTVKFTALSHVIASGTNASFRLQLNGADVSGYGTSGTPLRVTTTVATVDQTDVTLRDGDRITAVVSAVSSTPANATFVLHLQMS